MPRKHVSQSDSVLTRDLLAIRSKDPTGTRGQLEAHGLQSPRGKRHRARYTHVWKLCETSGKPSQWDAVTNTTV